MLLLVRSVLSVAVFMFLVFISSAIVERDPYVITSANKMNINTNMFLISLDNITTEHYLTHKYMPMMIGEAMRTQNFPKHTHTMEVK